MRRRDYTRFHYQYNGDAKYNKMNKHMCPVILSSKCCWVTLVIVIFFYMAWHYTFRGTEYICKHKFVVDTTEFCSFNPISPNYDCIPISPYRPPFSYTPAIAALPLVSVIIPCYNCVRYGVKDAIQSILLQSLQDFEIILVDDGSSADASFDKSFADTHQIKIVRHSKNRGLSAARNTGILHARGHYIFFLDADDLIEPTTLEKCVWTLVSHSDIGFTKGYTVGFDGQHYKWDKGFELGEKFLFENIVTATAMFRKAVFDKIGGFDETNKRGMEDWDFWLKCANNGIWGITIPEYLDWYRRKSDGEGAWSNFIGDRKVRFEKILREKYKQLYKTRKFPKVGGLPQVDYDVPTHIPFLNYLSRNSTKPRLLIIVPWFTMGGADRFNLNLVSELVQKGWEVTLVATHSAKGASGEWAPLFSRLTPDIFILSNYVRLQDYPRMLCYLIKSRDVDAVLITNSEAGYLLLPYLRSYCSGPAYIDYVHMEETYWKNGGFARYSVFSSEYLDAHVSSSNHLKQWMLRLNPDVSPAQTDVIAAKTHVVYIGVDPLQFKRDEHSKAKVFQKYNIPNSHMVILFAARLVPQKQPLLAMKVLKALADQDLNFTALIAGEGPLRPQVDEFISRYKLSKWVTILGEVPPTEMPMLMSASDVIFLPSKFEGIASLMYEGMAMEIAIVGSDVGGQSELVSPDVGFLLNSSIVSEISISAQHYESFLRKLILHPEERKKMGNAGRKRILAHFTIKKMGDSIERILCSLVKHKRMNTLQDTHSKLSALYAANIAMQFLYNEEQFDGISRKASKLQLWQESDNIFHQHIEESRVQCHELKKAFEKQQKELATLTSSYYGCMEDTAALYVELDDIRAILAKKEEQQDS